MLKLTCPSKIKLVLRCGNADCLLALTVGTGLDIWRYWETTSLLSYWYMLNTGPWVDKHHGDTGEIINWGKVHRKDRETSSSSGWVQPSCWGDAGEKTYEISPNESLRGVQLKCWEALAVMNIIAHGHHQAELPHRICFEILCCPSLLHVSNMERKFSWETCWGVHRDHHNSYPLWGRCGCQVLSMVFMWIISPTWILGTAIWGRFYYFLHFCIWGNWNREFK